jgi:hypothetical protein
MAVTDLTDSLPYWARQGVGYGGGPGPTGGPGSAPMGAGNSASWLQYLQQMFGISPANAAELGAGGSSPLSGGNDGNNPYQAAANVAQPSGPSILPQARGAAVPPNIIGSQPSIRAVFPPSILPQARGVAVPPGPMAPGSTTMAPAAAAPGAANPLAAAGPGAAGPGGATGAGATSNPRFSGIDRPNADPGIGGGMLGGARGGPQATALNLAGLFGGGGAPGAPRGVNPANLPAPAAQTVSGPLAQGGIANAPLPPTMPDDLRRQRAIQLAAARSGFA